MKKKIALTVLTVVMMAWSVACGSLATSVGESLGGDGGGHTGSDGGSMSDAGSSKDAGASSDSGGAGDAGLADSGTPADAGSDGGPVYGEPCLTSIDCVYGRVCHAGMCEKTGDHPNDAGSSDAGQADTGTSDGGTGVDAGEDAGAPDGGGTEDGGTGLDAGMDAGAPVGSFSCPFYPAGTRPGPGDQPGTAALAFTLAGTALDFSKCRGDVETADPFYGSVFTISLVDDSKGAQWTVYLYSIGVAADRHVAGVGGGFSSAGPVWGDLYELTVDYTGAIIRAVWRGYGMGGSLVFSQIGSAGTPTEGKLDPAVVYEAFAVVCDNADPEPAYRCPTRL
jgi:hypothetical protein